MTHLNWQQKLNLVALEVVALPGLARKKKQQPAKLNKSIYMKQLDEDNFDSLDLAAEFGTGGREAFPIGWISSSSKISLSLPSG